MKTIQAQPGRNGFTLVELLVTVTIILVLGALVFLGFARVREAADQTTTIHRIKSLADANIVYAADHGGKYVPVYSFDEDSKASVQWHYNQTFLEPLIGIKKALEEFEVHEGADGLPEQVLDPIVIRAKKKDWSRISGSFGYNHENMDGGWGQPNVDRSYTINTVPDPVKTCAFITATDWIAKYSGRYLWRQQGFEGKTPDGKIAYRHGDKAVVVFYDGHTELISMEQMREIDRRGGIDNIFWGGDEY